MPSAAVYRLRDRVFMHPWQRTTLGLGIASEPYVSLPLDAGDAELGAAVLNALSLSRGTLPHPESPRGLQAARLKAAGVRSEKAFQSDALSLTVELLDRTIRIVPSRNGGTSGESKGFHGLPDRSVSLPFDAGARELGAAICECFERCS